MTSSVFVLSQLKQFLSVASVRMLYTQQGCDNNVYAKPKKKSSSVPCVKPKSKKKRRKNKEQYKSETVGCFFGMVIILFFFFLEYVCKILEYFICRKSWAVCTSCAIGGVSQMKHRFREKTTEAPRNFLLGD